ncbi:hypothetical protein KUTeg_011361 [Tegillarca granosa]|uniref:Transmembrane protein 135 N-terminal domain-containing protein n=1 Tax=Tegillarca granosa TaxID=220873 RepID=A0ABQ9F485_TEGGR|nr:hypothetical protein KUTeg_011361 [Tegillarca granosa]
MAILSKPTSLEFTCYELGHTWTPSCKKATADVVIQVFKQGLMIYGPLYLERSLGNIYGQCGYRDSIQNGGIQRLDKTYKKWRVSVNTCMFYICYIEIFTIIMFFVFLFFVNFQQKIKKKHEKLPIYSIKQKVRVQYIDIHVIPLIPINKFF